MNYRCDRCGEYGIDTISTACPNGCHLRGYDLDSVSVPCPVGEVANDPHAFRVGSGVVVEWDIMGDLRRSVEVCADCAEGVES